MKPDIVAIEKLLHQILGMIIQRICDHAQCDFKKKQSLVGGLVSWCSDFKALCDFCDFFFCFEAGSLLVFFRMTTLA